MESVFSLLSKDLSTNNATWNRDWLVNMERILL